MASTVRRGPWSGGLLVLLVVVDLGEFRVDHVLFLAAGIARATSITRSAGAVLLRLVHGLAELHRGLGQCVGLGGDRLGVVALERLFQVGHGVLDGAALRLAHLGAVLGDRLLRRMQQRLGVVLGL